MVFLPTICSLHIRNSRRNLILAGKFSLQGNNVFPFVPDASQALSREMWQDGVRVIVPMWRTDIYGNELVGAVKEEFGKLGGTVLDGIGYIPSTGDFFASL